MKLQRIRLIAHVDLTVVELDDEVHSVVKQLVLRHGQTAYLRIISVLSAVLKVYLDRRVGFRHVEVSFDFKLIRVQAEEVKSDAVGILLPSRNPVIKRVFDCIIAALDYWDILQDFLCWHLPINFSNCCAYPTELRINNGCDDRNFHLVVLEGKLASVEPIKIECFDVFNLSTTVQEGSDQARRVQND